MRLATPTRGFSKWEKVIDVFEGFNNTEMATERHFSETKNLSADKYPSVTTRPYRVIKETLGVPNGVFSFKGVLYTVDGTAFKKGGVTKGAVTSGIKQMIEFNEYVLIFPDLAFYDTVNDVFGSFVNGTINPVQNPLVTKATVHNNRVFGVKGNQIFASKQGDFKEWNVFEQLNTDSWATDVAGAVTFKTIGTYQNHVVVQSEVNMFELYGYKPANFQLQETVKVGSFVHGYVEINSALYFVNREGIYVFTGGLPRKISGNLDMAIESAEVGSDGRRLFASVNVGASYKLFVYDTETGTFYQEDNLRVLQFALHAGYLHAMCNDGKIIIFNANNSHSQTWPPETVEWAFTTTELKEDTSARGGIKTIEIYCEMGERASMNIFVKGDSDPDWAMVKSFDSETHRNLLIPVILSKNCYKIKVEGRGYVKISSIKRTVQRGGRI